MNRAGVALLTVSHVVDDLYQGAVPALLPFLVAERHYSYAAASGWKAPTPRPERAIASQVSR